MPKNKTHLLKQSMFAWTKNKTTQKTYLSAIFLEVCDAPTT